MVRTKCCFIHILSAIFYFLSDRSDHMETNLKYAVQLREVGQDVHVQVEHL